MVTTNQGNPEPDHPEHDGHDAEPVADQDDTQPKLTKNGAVQHSVTDDTVVIKGSVRRRCAGTNVRGERCKAFSLHSGDLCRVHQEIQDTGEVKFGSLTLQEAGAKSGRVRQAQVHLRKTLLPAERITPRSALQALALAKSTHLASRAIEAALEGEPTPAKGSLALRIVEVADPAVTAEVSFPMPGSWDEFSALPEEAQRKMLLHGLEMTPWRF